MAPRPLVTLFAAAFVALSAGTNYAISSYAPQLAVRLGLSVTQLNIVSTSANMGMYLTGSFAGPVIDKRGPRIVLLFSAVVLFTGWTLMRAFYDGGPNGIFSKLGVPGLAFAQLLTGVGSSMSNGSAVNGVARSFTVKRRATALSLVFCCTGLSAFVYSTASRLLFDSSPNATSHFLLLLSLGCASSLLIGAVFASGRIVIGAISDYFGHRAPRKYRVARVWFTLPVATLFVVSLTMARNTVEVKGLHGLMPPTALTGFAYGCLWGLMPVLCLDWFGLQSYSSNNGLLVLAPAIYGQITNLSFGKIYDSHAKTGSSLVLQQALCTKGNACYAGALEMAIGMAMGAMVLAVVAGMRRGRSPAAVKDTSVADGLVRSRSIDGATL
ncbi:hypothetical protein RQP46_009841 [Phenoliferia psychrophenolica]